MGSPRAACLPVCLRIQAGSPGDEGTEPVGQVRVKGHGRRLRWVVRRLVELWVPS